MPTIREGGLEFVFPEDWQVEKYDETAFYRKRFQKFADSKCVDIVAFSSTAESLWLIEVKDYRRNRREKTISLFDELARKVRDTLASLYIAQRQTDVDIYEFANQAAKKPKIRVAMHLEQSNPPSRLYPLVEDRSNAEDKLQQAVRTVDPHPWLCETGKMPLGCPWQVISQA